MSTPEKNQGETTELLGRVNQGDKQAVQELYERVEERLLRIARIWLARKLPQQDLESQLLADDAFLKLVNDERIVWEDGAHFLGLAHNSMRQGFIDNLRAANAKARGGGKPPVRDPECLAAIPNRRTMEITDKLALDEALQKLEKRDRVSHEVVQLKLQGHTFKEIGDKLGLGLSGAYRTWQFASLWLRQELEGEDGNGQ